MKLEVGNKAPDFTLPTNSDGQFTLSKDGGKLTCVFFYPKDDTSGCTAEAIDFTANKEAFDKLGVVLLGMSPDPVKKHDKFIAKHELSVNLASDEEKTTLEAYGVWVEKSMYGRKYMGVERSTFLIDDKLEIKALWRKVKVPGHVDEVLASAKEIIG